MPVSEVERKLEKYFHMLFYIIFEFSLLAEDSFPYVREKRNLCHGSNRSLIKPMSVVVDVMKSYRVLKASCQHTSRFGR